MDRQARHSQAASKAAMRRNGQWSIFNEGKGWAEQVAMLNGQCSMFNEGKGYGLRGWREYDRTFNIEN
jgi:hypothetical protein